MKTKRLSISIISILLLLFLFCAPATIASAHPADMYYQKTYISLSEGQITISWEIYPGTMFTPGVWQDADADGDGNINTAEAWTWADKISPEISAFLNSNPLSLSIDSILFPQSFTAMEVEKEGVTIILQADLPTNASIQNFTLLNQHYDGITIHWFTVEAEAGVLFQQPQQDGGQLTFNFQNFDNDSTGKWMSAWDSGTPSITTSESLTTTTTDETAPAETSITYTSAVEILTDMINIPQLNPLQILLILLAALLLGGIHALTPGHGKTLVAAYLVGSRGTLKHAVVLGLIVTLTHTGSVLAIGAVTLLASEYLLPAILLPGLEIVSSLLIVGIGAFLLRRAWIGYQSVRKQIRPLKKETALPSSTKSGQSRRIEIGIPIETRVYDDLIPGQETEKGVAWRSILTLGVSGGLVPCPDAIAILFVAAAIDRTLLGILLILVFSLGMAVVLILIGILFVRGRGIMERFNRLKSLTSLMPLISAVIILVLGIVITFNIIRSSNFQIAYNAILNTISTGNETETSISIQPANEFELSEAKFLYLATAEDNKRQLALYDFSDQSTTQLTFAPNGIQEYTISPDQSTAAYLAIEDNGSLILYFMDLNTFVPEPLIDFQEGYVSELSWSVDGQRINYQILEWLDLTENSFTSLRWIDIDTLETKPFFQDSQLPSFNASFSPDGDWLAYITTGLVNTLQIYNVKDGSSLVYPILTSHTAIWAPDSSSVLFFNFLQDSTNIVQHLFLVNLEYGSLTDLSGSDDYQDWYAAYSHSGDQIILIRQELEENIISTSSQIWIMNADGSNPIQLTDSINFIQGLPVWSPDDRYLIFDGTTIVDRKAVQSIWLFDLQTESLQELIPDAVNPAWITVSDPE